MINNLIEHFRDKKIVILGFGREGISTYKVIRKYLPNQHLYISDIKDVSNNEVLKEDTNITIISGEGYLDHLEDYDIIMKTPGISFAGMDISKFKDKIESQLELLLRYFKVTTIGVTATKGKSTTSSLIYQILKDQGRNTMLLGNIGTPAFDFVDEIETDTVIVLEISCHQLEFMDVSPNISILLNIYPEHLDHYNSFEDYALAKCQIYKNQTEKDYFLYSFDEEILKGFIGKSKATTFKVSTKSTDVDVYLKNDRVYFNGKEIYDVNTPRNLVGDYNLSNIMFVLAVSEILKLNLNKTIKTISEFKSLPHRLELVGEYNGVYYYDNSIATIPKATIEAVNALKTVDTLIIGGMDRGLDYSEFVDFLNESAIANIICMPKTGHDIAPLIKSEKRQVVDTLEEAVETAKKLTEKGKICLLSPAAASYGFFKNFEEKGDIYQALVKKN